MEEVRKNLTSDTKEVVFGVALVKYFHPKPKNCTFVCCNKDTDICTRIWCCNFTSYETAPAFESLRTTWKQVLIIQQYCIYMLKGYDRSSPSY